MKRLKILALPVIVLLFLSSCVSVRVLSDYDKEANFSAYKTYAFYKTGIDKAHLSDLDKKRILKAIDAEMSSRGMVKSENPDIFPSGFRPGSNQVSRHRAIPEPFHKADDPASPQSGCRETPTVLLPHFHWSP